MQLNEILEANSLKEISRKTNISEANIEALLTEKFDCVVKSKALGFISIIEREYEADLTLLREEALAYYETHEAAQESIIVVPPESEYKKGISRGFLLLVVLLLLYVSWYFLIQFDQKNVNQLFPLTEEKAQVEDPVTQESIPKEFSIESAISSLESDRKSEASEMLMQESKEDIKKRIPRLPLESETVKSNMIVPKSELNLSLAAEDTNATLMQTKEITHTRIPTEESSITDEPTSSPFEISDQNETLQRVQTVLEPKNRLWFGMIEMDTKKRKHLTISEKYTIDTKEKSWLIATSSAPFSLIHQGKTQKFNDAKEHYFKIDKSGVTQLTKSEYVSMGGWKEW